MGWHCQAETVRRGPGLRVGPARGSLRGVRPPGTQVPGGQVAAAGSRRPIAAAARGMRTDSGPAGTGPGPPLFQLSGPSAAAAG